MNNRNKFSHLFGPKVFRERKPTRLSVENLELRQLLASDANAGIGLLAQYYNASDLSSYQAAAITGSIDAQWGTGSPVVGTPATPLSPDNFSIRWSGEIESSFTESHTFFVNAEGGVRLWVNGKLLLDRWNDTQIVDGQGTIELIAGRRYDLQLEFRELSGNAGIRLEWLSASVPREIVPTSRLFASERGTVSVEQWNGISGSTVASLTVSPQFALQPNSVSSVTSFATAANVGDNFGRRVRGLLHAPATGFYRFYLNSDQAAELWLGNTSDASSKQRIANVDTPTVPGQWTSTPSQQSSPIYLVAGQSYYIEALHKEATGSDHLSVGWLPPAASSIAIIPGDLLSPIVSKVQLFANAPMTVEGSTTFTNFSVVRDDSSLTNSLTVNYRTRGTASSGTDYVPLPGSITIPAGQRSVDINVAALSDALLEGLEQVEIELIDGPGYEVGLISQRTAVASIQDVRPTPSGGVSQISGGRLVDFSNRYGATYTEVTDSDSTTNFGLVIQAAIATTPASVFSVQLSQRNIQPINSGDIILAEFYIRSIGAPGKAQLVYELAASPFTKILSQSVNVPTTWTRIQVPVVAAQSYAINTASFSFQLGAQAQTLQIARPQLLNFGPSKNLVPTAGLSINNISGTWGTLSTVQVFGQQFTNASRIQTVTPPPAGSAWQFQSVMRNATSVKSGNTLSVEFYARSVAGTTPRLQVQSQRTDTFASVFAAQEVPITGAWQKFSYRFPVNADFAVNGLQLVFIAGFGVQTVEVADLKWINTNATASLEDFPSLVTPVSYTGRDGAATWRNAADDRIEQHRQANLTVNVIDTNGQPVDGALVSIQQTEHAFKFGTAADDTSGLLSTNSTTALQYQELIKRLFNTVVMENSMKWPQYANNPQRAINAANWVIDNGMYLRGHNIIWPSRDNMPTSVWAQYDSLLASQGATAAQNTLRTTIQNHITEAVNTFSGKAGEWDVMNEPFTNNDVMTILGDSVVFDWFRQVNQLSPSTLRVLNDYDIFARNGGNTAHRANFDSWLQRLDSQNLIEMIGEQSHYNEGNLTNIETLGNLINLYHTTYNLPIAITELDVNTKDQQLQADYLRDYLTQSFSQPGIAEILQWGFWSEMHWIPDAALYNADFSIKPSGQVYEDLVFGDWWTDTRGTTRSGTLTTNATFGDYEIEVTIGNQKVTRTVSNLLGNAIVQVTMPGVLVTPTVIQSAEGSSPTFSLSLSTQPTADVVISFVGNAAQATITPSQVTFTTANWNVPKIVNVQLIEDYIVEGNQQLVIGHTVSSADSNYQALLVPAVLINFTDGTNPSLAISNNTVVENALAGTVVGLLSAANAVQTETYQFSTVAGTGSTDNSSFTIVGNQLRTSAIFDFESKSSYSIRVRALDSKGQSFERIVAINVGNAPEQIGSIVVGDGSSQRSVVKQLLMEFDTAIEIDPNAFSVAKRTKNTNGDLVLTPVVTALASTLLSNGHTKVTLSFVSALRPGTAVLEDGNYQLTVDGNKIRTTATSFVFDGDRNAATEGGNYLFGTLETDRFFSQFGNINGDRQVNEPDYYLFRTSYLRRSGQPGYRPQFDFNGDNKIDLIDFQQFRRNYGKQFEF